MILIHCIDILPYQYASQIPTLCVRRCVCGWVDVCVYNQFVHVRLCVYMCVCVHMPVYIYANVSSSVGK